MQSVNRQSAFVLPMTLVLLMIAAVVLVSTARSSVSLALQALDAETDLQRRWAQRSMRQVLLPRVRAILNKAEGVPEPKASSVDRLADEVFPRTQPGSDVSAQEPLEAEPVPGVRVSLQLAGYSYELWLTDEQARLHVGRMYLEHRGDRELTRRDLEQVVDAESEFSIDRPRFALRPMPGAVEVARSLPTSREGVVAPAAGLFASWGQVFDLPDPEAAMGSREQPGVAAQITCWGDGRVSVRRASRSVIKAAVGDRLSEDQIDTLLELRDEDLAFNYELALQSMELNDRSRRELKGLLIKESNCYGLWVRWTDGRRNRHMMAVQEGSAEPGNQDAGSRVIRFEW